jgi:hypothetical protein
MPNAAEIPAIHNQVLLDSDSASGGVAIGAGVVAYSGESADGDAVAAAVDAARLSGVKVGKSVLTNCPVTWHGQPFGFMITTIVSSYLRRMAFARQLIRRRVGQAH